MCVTHFSFFFFPSMLRLGNYMLFLFVFSFFGVSFSSTMFLGVLMSSLSLNIYVCILAAFLVSMGSPLCTVEARNMPSQPNVNSPSVPFSPPSINHIALIFVSRSVKHWCVITVVFQQWPLFSAKQ